MKIKNILLIVFLLSYFNTTIYAAFVSKEKARVVGRNFYHEKINYFHKVNFEDLIIEQSLTISENGEPLYYIFNFKNLGFIIVSAEDASFPVLGYSFENNIINAEPSPAYDSWMSFYTKQIIEIKKNNIKYKESSVFSKTKELKGVEPLLLSNWSQGYYYNAMCPVDPEGTGGHAISGCVAIAMAQVMYYFRYPEFGEGSHGYESDYGYEFADFENTNYKWDEMVNRIFGAHNPAIAELIYHVGVSVEMNYGPNSSGADTYDTPDALRNYFRYNENVQYIARADTNVSFEDSLIMCLDRNIPLIYRGGGLIASHSFVCDGYQDSTFFHFNWGWGGWRNGYYNINNLNPGYDFTFNQCAVINIYPREDYPQYCQETDSLTKSQGTFFDGSGPENYQNNQYCKWLITPDDTEITNIQIWFPQFDTENEKDLVKIFDGSTEQDPLLGVFSGHEIPPVLSSTGDEALVVFISDTANVDKGWFAEYMAYSGPFCDGVTTLNDTSRLFSDGSGPYNYTNNSDCKWLIDPQGFYYDSVSNIDLYFLYFDLASDDTLFIYNGESENAPVIEKFTGSEIPDTVHVNGNKIFMNFKTNEINTSEGWTAGYKSYLPVYCNDTTILTDSTGVFEDGSSDKNYTNNSECYWLIEPDNVEAITITFTKFDIEYGYDQVNIYDASVMPPVLDTTFWGHDIPASRTIKSGRVLVKFTSDYALVFDGWEAQYSVAETSVNENSFNHNFEVFPNPSSGEINISANFPKASKLDIEVFSIAGKSLFQKTFDILQGKNLLHLDLKGLSKGVYYLKVTEFNKVIKIIVW
ncbi:MAG: hypothetical protein B6D61_04310 [Bacteroidetes bacterium 4484_249]|nr:MAG: hypothetical protein B6D61_04310 [Bacteroidetes bacterium 4484_249]